MNELRDLHPEIEQYLIANGYEYEREVKMPEYGKVDFVATHPITNTKYIIEAKIEGGRRFGRYCAQLLDYIRQYEGQGVMVLPTSESGEYERSVADFYGFLIWDFDISDSEWFWQRYETLANAYKHNVTILKEKFGPLHLVTESQLNEYAKTALDTFAFFYAQSFETFQYNRFVLDRYVKDNIGIMAKHVDINHRSRTGASDFAQIAKYSDGLVNELGIAKDIQSSPTEWREYLEAQDKELHQAIEWFGLGSNEYNNAWSLYHKGKFDENTLTVLHVLFMLKTIKENV